MYIFGTIHIGVPIQDVPSVVMDKFDQSERFDMEVDSKNYDTEKSYNKEAERIVTEYYAILNSLHKANPEAANRLAERVEMKNYLQANKPLPVPQKKLSQRLTAKAWGYTRAYFKQMDLETLERVSPETIVSFISDVQVVTIEAPPAWFTRMDPKFSMDLNFQSRAREQGKQIYQLDDAEVLSETCSDLVSSAQIVGHFDSKSAQDLVKEFEVLEKAYRSGDESEVAMISFRDDPGLEKCLLHDRNQKWIPRLIADSEGAAMRGQPPLFVAFGTAHLFGPYGILELLKKEGYTVQRIER